ncbi:hypothetical protein LTR85_000056 [Meristemomyces frigidus]|nr:hypothetical protein LTR85_000056 [Meristemomyces frigidus]
MEVTSPPHSNLYDDIELDFDDGNFEGGVQLEEDEHMLTDGEQTRPATATDDMMDDDAQIVEPAAPETAMRDTPDVEQQVPAQQEDEELIDYGDEEYYDQHQTEDTAVEDVAEVDYAQQPGEGALEDVDEEIVRHPEDAGLDQSSVLLTEEPAVRVESADATQTHPSVQDESAYADHAVFAGDENAFETGDNNDQTLVAEPEADDAQAEVAISDLSTQVFAGDAEALQPPLTIDTTSGDYVDASADAPGTPTDTGLHPVTVYYGEHMMPLFKSKRQPDGLLKDDNLASLSLAELMRNCRQRLALKIGNVPEEQEFTLAFDHMGLMLLENSRAAFEHSLNDVLEVYLQLHHNDGTDDVSPLSITLSHEQFSSHLALLQQAAASGKGIYDFVPRDDADEQEYYDDEEKTGEVDDSNVFPEEQAGLKQYYDGGENHVSGEYTQDQGEFEQGYYEEAANRTETGEDDVHHAQQQPGLEADGASGREASNDEALTTAEEAQYPAAEDAASADVDNTHGSDHDGDRENGEPVVSLQETHDEVRKAESSASSQTVQGDHANGEYDEDDLIDWDEDSSLTSTTSELPADGQDDFSTLTEFDDGEAKAGRQSTAESDDDAQHEVITGDVQKAPEDLAGVHAGGQHAVADDPQPQILGSEDFLNDDQDQFGNAEGLQREEDQGQKETQEQNHDDQADTFDEQQDEFQPGEEEEQYHTAHDFLNGESYEHGPQQQAEDHTGNYGEANHQIDHAGHEDDLYDDFLNGDSYEQEPETYAPQEAHNHSIPDPEDDIGFDDDTTEQHEARKASQHEIAAVTSGSPLGKRSFEQHADLDDLDFDEPDLKKVRSD